MGWETVKRWQRPVFGLALGLLLASASTWIAFHGGFFAINNDGEIHLARMESIYQALHAGRLPSLVNFIGYSHRGTAMNAMYPWLTTMIFVAPRLLGANPIAALAVGFFLLNVVTLAGGYLLARQLTRSELGRWLGVMVYQFNAYHFQLMYTRVDLGEALGYAFLPLIMLGLFKIWQRDWRGTLWLGLGMGLVGNSHWLSLLLFTGTVMGLEVIRLFQHRIDWFELRSLLMSAGLALVLASYSLVNSLTWMVHNRMVTPTPSLIPLDPTTGWTRLLQNDFAESANGAHIGLAASLILLLLVSRLFSATSGSWRGWIVGAAALLVIAQNWLPWRDLANTPLQLLQFTMRLLTLVAMGLMIGVVLYFEQTKLPASLTVWALSSFLIVIALTGVAQIREQTQTAEQWADRQPLTSGQQTRIIEDDRHYLTTHNYQADLDAMTMADYMLKKTDLMGVPVITKAEKQDLPVASRLNKLAVAFDNKAAAQFQYQNANDEQVRFSSAQKRDRLVKLPVVGYHHVNYQVTVNGRVVPYQRSQGQLLAKLAAGQNQVTISVAHNTKHGWWLCLSVLATLATVVGLVWRRH